MDNIFKIWPLKTKKTKQVIVEPENPTKADKSQLPVSRVSQPNLQQTFADLGTSLEFVKPSFLYDNIPVIRKLYSINSSVSLAANSIMELANTGHSIEFDHSVSSTQAIKMRKHIEMVSKNWCPGTVGLHGIINKLILQVYIGGALSGEWVLKNDLTGVKYLALLNPETIRAAFDSKDQTYKYYQVPKSFMNLRSTKAPKQLPENYIKLNPFTYQYYGFLSDEESPVGIPPFLSALDDIQSQLKMLKNIGFVSDQLGLLGFLEVLLTKPVQRSGESDVAYTTRLNTMLDTAKRNIKDGTKDGVVAGFKDDHEFEFHATSKDTGNAADIFDMNQRMVANGLQTSPQFLGGAVGGTETLITVVFTKMLSQLSNIQEFVKAVLEKGIYLELLLAGYNINSVTVKFKPSTITDELKTEQSAELKVRNSRILYADGIINIDEYAKRVGYEKADQREPRAEINPDKIMEKADAEKQDQKNENKTATKTREKNKTQPKRKDTK